MSFKEEWEYLKLYRFSPRAYRQERKHLKNFIRQRQIAKERILELASRPGLGVTELKLEAQSSSTPEAVRIAFHELFSQGVLEIKEHKIQIRPS